jgi:2-polyprenyl-3-methyl-5-hydroxy-6-metoxy-1,4-benzoquinol methylase
MINKTQLDLTKAEERQLVHRDYLAHCLRWSHIIQKSNIGETVLDLGCADAPLAMMYYTNKFKPSFYIGVDIRQNIIIKNRKLTFNFKTEFLALNLITEFHLIPLYEYTIITLLEVLEHVEHDDGLKILNNITKLLNDKTTLFISTPCFNGEKARNHVYEWRYDELKIELEKRFKILEVHGTFASQRNIKPILSTDELTVFNKLHDYYDSNVLAIFFAPLHPAQSRNCLWTLKKL